MLAVHTTFAATLGPALLRLLQGRGFNGLMLGFI